MKFERLEATTDAGVGLCGPAKHVGGALPRVLKGRLHREARFTFSLKYLTYFFFNHCLCAKFLEMESGEERRANQSSFCFLGWVPLDSLRLMPLIDFSRWFFLFIYLRYVLKKKGRQKSYPKRNTFFFLMGKNTQLYLGTEWSSANEFTLVKHWNSPRHTN